MADLSKVSPDELYRQVRCELARRSYEEYLQFITKDTWKPLPHLRPLVDIAQRILDGERDMRVIINCPPQVGKSFTLSENLPAAYLGKFPNRRVLVSAYGDHLSQKFGRSNRKAVKEYGKLIFGRGLDPSKSAEQEFAIENATGEYYGVTMLGGATGASADLLIIDDPVKNRTDANSPTMRDKTYEEYVFSFRTRFQDGTNVIIIMTRWHEDDLCGRLLKSGDWEHIVLRAEAEEDDILGRKPGEPIAPYPPLNRDKKWLEQVRKDVGSRAYIGLFQQRPSPADGEYFLEGWFKYYTEIPKFGSMGISVDATFKDSKTSDYVAIQVWGYANPNFYLVYEYRKQMGFTETVKAIERTVHMFPRAYLKLIEDKANGSAVIDVLKNKVKGIVPINPDGGKESRANAVTPFFEAGNVFIPHESAVFTLQDRDGVDFTLTNEWVERYKSELKQFPNSKHDDSVDCTTQILNHWAKPTKRRRISVPIQGL